MIKTSIEPQDKRQAQRLPLSGLMPGKVRYKDKIINAKPVDISKTGLGLVVDHPIKAGEIISLETLTEKHVFTVAWSKPDFGKHDFFRLGIMAQDPTFDVEKFFKDNGCLK